MALRRDSILQPVQYGNRHVKDGDGKFAWETHIYHRRISKKDAAQEQEHNFSIDVGNALMEKGNTYNVLCAKLVETFGEDVKEVIEDPAVLLHYNCSVLANGEIDRLRGVVDFTVECEFYAEHFARDHGFTYQDDVKENTNDTKECGDDDYGDI